MSILHRALAATTIVLVAGFGVTACSATDTAPKTDKGKRRGPMRRSPPTTSHSV